MEAFLFWERYVPDVPFLYMRTMGGHLPNQIPIPLPNQTLRPLIPLDCCTSLCLPKVHFDTLSFSIKPPNLVLQPLSPGTQTDQFSRLINWPLCNQLPSFPPPSHSSFPMRLDTFHDGTPPVAAGTCNDAYSTILPNSNSSFPWCMSAFICALLDI